MNPPVLAAVALVCALAPLGSDADGGTRTSAACPVSRVHYGSYPDVGRGLGSVPWIATDRDGSFYGHLFYYGATPWSKQRPAGARIFTTVERRNVNPKVLWIPRRSGAGSSLRIVGTRLDAPGTFAARYDAASGGTYPSYVSVPAAGCWRVTLRSGRLWGSVVFAAVDSF